MGKQLLEVLGAQDGDLCKKQLALYEGRLGVVEDSPHRDKVLELAAGLLDNAVLALQHNGHARQVVDLGVAHDQAVNVEATSGQNARDAREHTGLVLHQAIQDVSLGRGLRGQRGLVEDAADGGLGRPCWAVLGGQGRDAAVEGFVCERLGRRRTRGTALADALLGEQAA